MSHHLTDELAQSLVDGLLPAALRDGCEAHVAACAECRIVVESYRALGDALAGLDAPLPPPDFTDAVMDRIEARERVHAWERRLALGIVGVAACAALAILAFVGASAWAPILSRVSDGVGDAARAFTLGASVLSPVLRALRLQIALGCAAVGLPLLFALSRLVPRRAEAPI
jgi:anti-sigma factor RsiW